MQILHFTDERINEIHKGSPMTSEERSFLLTDTPRFEECTHKADELASMTDSGLMHAAYGVWADYAR